MASTRGPSLKSTAILAVAALAAAAAQEEDPAALFAEVIDVRVVNIEVVVTDRDGDRVHGLKPSDFELLVDGETTPIDFFTEIEDGVAREAAGSDVAAAPGIEPDAPAGTNFLLFIDDFFAIQSHRNRVLEGLGDDLWEHLVPADHVAAVAFDGRSAETLTPWTNQPDVWEEALERARARPAHGVHRLSELSQSADDRRLHTQLEAVADQAFTEPVRFEELQLAADLEESDPQAAQRAERLAAEDAELLKDILGTSLSAAELRYAKRLDDQLRRSVLAAVATMRRFANRPGRKVMLILAGGWPRSPALFAVADDAGNFEDFAVAADGLLMNEDELYGPLAATANLIGFSLYPVDVPGAGAGFAGDGFAGDASRPVPAQPRNAGDGARRGAINREHLLHGTLEQLARSTGGLPMINARRDAALARTFEDTRSWYWLGFQSPRREDDAFRRVEVRLVDRPALRARSREGYVDMSRDREIATTVEAALMFDGVPGAQRLDARLSQPVRAGRGRMSVHVEIAIPLDDVGLLPVAGTWRNELQFRAIAMDMEGARSEMAAETIPITGPRKPRPGQTFFYETDLQLRRREHRYVLALYDPVAGAILTAAGEIRPP